jgi:predicted nucleic acid-binding protein
VLTRLLAERPIDVGLSVITEAELRTGAAKSASSAKTTRGRLCLPVAERQIDPSIRAAPIS